MRPAEPPPTPQLTHPACLGGGSGEGAVRLVSLPSAPLRGFCPSPSRKSPLPLPQPPPPILSSPLGLGLYCTAWSARPRPPPTPRLTLKPGEGRDGGTGAAPPTLTARVSAVLGEPLFWLGPKLPRLICLKPGDLPQPPSLTPESRSQHIPEAAKQTAPPRPTPCPLVLPGLLLRLVQEGWLPRGHGHTSSVPGHVFIWALAAWPVVVVGGDGCQKSLDRREQGTACGLQSAILDRGAVWPLLPLFVLACLPPTYLTQTCQKCQA